MRNRGRCCRVCCCPVRVRALSGGLSGSGLRPEGLLSRQTPSKIRDGIRPGQWAVLVTVNGVPQSRKLSEKHSQERTGSASAVGFVATVAEPFRSGKRVRARITARQAPFRKERGTPCGSASLRGVDRPRPAPVKALPLCSECLSLPQRGNPFRTASSFLTKFRSSILYRCLAGQV
jgi:hypothetical protein